MIAFEKALIFPVYFPFILLYSMYVYFSEKSVEELTEDYKGIRYVIKVLSFAFWLIVILLIYG